MADSMALVFRKLDVKRSMNRSQVAYSDKAAGELVIPLNTWKQLLQQPLH